MNNDNSFSEYIPNVHFELIPIKNLVSNQKYQRDLSMIHVTKAAQNFDLNQINPIKVSRRDGVNYVFNGQHTAEIVAMVSGSRDTPVWCMIYDDLEYTEEADIFANQMKNVKALTAVEIFNANCEAGNEESLLIRDLIESYDMKVGSSPLPGNIMAIGTIESIYYKYGYDVLDRVLKLIIATWEGELKSFSANILNGVTRLICAYGDNLDDEVFKEKLGIISIKEITKIAKERRVGSLGYSEAMLIYYNKKLKHPLQWPQLYSSKNDKKKAKERSVRERQAEELQAEELQAEGLQAEGLQVEGFLAGERQTGEWQTGERQAENLRVGKQHVEENSIAGVEGTGASGYMADEGICHITA